jgi:hypothetical protein
MTERVQQTDGSGRRAARREAPPSQAPDVRRGRPAPRTPPDGEPGPTVFGLRTDVADDGSYSGERLIVLRRADPIGGIVLALAGGAACVSLWLPWTEGEEAVGLSLFLRGVVFGSGFEELTRDGLWQPLAVVMAGGLLFFLGLLLLRPARTHRLVGVLALFVAVAAGDAVLDLVADVGWRPDRFDVGMWFAVAVPALGVLGAMKAMLTTPRVTIER